MRQLSKGLLLLLVLFVLAQGALAAEWRGIIPLRSTRADVVRLFGECANAEVGCEFMLPNEEILITFSTVDTCPAGVPPHTVLIVQRELQTGTTLQALGLDQRRFESFNPAFRRDRDYRGYMDEKSGLLLKSFRGEIFQINYIPTKKERAICLGLYRKPKDFVAVVP